MIDTVHVVTITSHELRLLDLLKREPQLVENLRRCTASQPHERSMLERLRVHLIRVVGAQRTAGERTGRDD